MHPEAESDSDGETSGAKGRCQICRLPETKAGDETVAGVRLAKFDHRIEDTRVGNCRRPSGASTPFITMYITW